jgi:NADPH:quinone reductase-like Zn-dependent oxidoreductase
MLLFNATEAELEEAHLAVSVGLRDGALRPVVSRELPLVEAPRAHHLLLERPAHGRIVLVP